MDELTGLGAFGALVAGLSSSLHCALMCGPLACAAGSPSKRAGAYWQGGRLLAYAALGAVLGASGSAAINAVAQGARPILPWLMAAGLVATAFDLPKRLAPLPGLRRVSSWVMKRSARFAPEARAGAMGALTPLLPCGLVYGISLAALAAGSTFGGFAVMGSFALGGVPALAAAQLGLAGRTGKIGFFFQRALPLLAAVVLIWRVMQTGDAPAGEHHCH